MMEHREEHIDDIPDHVNDKDGHISLFLMGMAMLLLMLLVVSILLAM